MTISIFPSEQKIVEYATREFEADRSFHALKDEEKQKFVKIIASRLAGGMVNPTIVQTAWPFILRDADVKLEQESTLNLANILCKIKPQGGFVSFPSKEKILEILEKNELFSYAQEHGMLSKVAEKFGDWKGTDLECVDVQLELIRKENKDWAELNYEMLFANIANALKDLVKK